MGCKCSCFFGTCCRPYLPTGVLPLQSATEHRARLACTARMQQLQAEVRPVPLAAPWATAAQQQQHRQGQQAGYAAQRRQFGAVCEICMHEEEEGDDAIIQVGACRSGAQHSAAQHVGHAVQQCRRAPYFRLHAGESAPVLHPCPLAFPPFTLFRTQHPCLLVPARQR